MSDTNPGTAAETAAADSGGTAALKPSEANEESKKENNGISKSPEKSKSIKQAVAETKKSPVKNRDENKPAGGVNGEEVLKADNPADKDASEGAQKDVAAVKTDKTSPAKQTDKAKAQDDGREEDMEVTQPEQSDEQAAAPSTPVQKRKRSSAGDAQAKTPTTSRESPRKRTRSPSAASSETPSEERTKRQRRQVEKFQANTPTQDPPTPSTPSSVRLYEKNTTLAVRADGASFYLCRCIAPVMNTQKRFKVRWFEIEQSPDLYRLAYEDRVELECVIGPAHLQRAKSGLLRLTAPELARIQQLIKAAEKGEDVTKLDPELFKPQTQTVKASAAKAVAEKEADNEGDTDIEPEEEEAEPTPKRARRGAAAKEATLKEKKPARKPRTPKSQTPKAEKTPKTPKAKGSGKKAAGPKGGKRKMNKVVSIAQAAPTLRRTATLQLTSTALQRPSSFFKRPSLLRRISLQRWPSIKVKPKRVKREPGAPRPKPDPNKKLKHNPRVTVWEKDPLVESKKEVPFVSSLMHSQLAIRAVKLGDAAMLQDVIDNVKQVHQVNIARSCHSDMATLDYALRSEKTDLVKMLLDNNKTYHSRVAAPICLMKTEGTGSYNPRTLPGVKAVRKLKMSRGGREGNNALVKDHTKVYTPSLSDSVTKALHENVSYETIKYLLDFNHVDQMFIYTNIVEAVKYGHRQLAAKLMADAVKAETYGFNFMHVESLKFDNDEDFSGKMLEASALKCPLSNDSMRPLHCAAINPNTKYLTKLLALCSNWNIQDNKCWRATHYAAACEGTGPLKLLIKKGVSLTEADNMGCTPLIIACITGRADNVKVILDHFLEQEKEQAKELGEEEDAKKKSKFGPGGINRPMKNTWCAIHYAVANKRQAVVKVLLDYGADVNKNVGANYNRVTPLCMAAQDGDLDFVKFLIDNHAKIEKPDKLKRTALIHAVRDGNANVASYLLNRGADPNTADSSGNTAMHYAAAYGWYFCMKALLDAGANPDPPNDWKLTPLGASFLKGNHGLTKILMEIPGVNIDFQDDEGKTLLHHTLEATPMDKNTVADVKLLVLEKNANVTLLDKSNKNCIHYVFDSPLPHERQWSYRSTERKSWEEARAETVAAQKEIIGILMDKGCDPWMEVDSRTILHNTFRKGEEHRPLEALELVMSRKPWLEMASDDNKENHLLHLLTDSLEDKQKWDMLHRIAKTEVDGKSGLTELRKMARLKTPTALQPTPLFKVCYNYSNQRKSWNQSDEDFEEVRSRSRDCIKFLIEDLQSELEFTVKKPERNLVQFTGKKVEKSKLQRYTVLSILVECDDDFKAFDMVFAHKPSIDFQIDNGRTLLMDKVRSGSYEVVKKLMDCGANINLKSEDKSDDGMTPLLLCLRHSRTDILAELLERGADRTVTNEKTKETVFHLAINHCKPVMTPLSTDVDSTNSPASQLSPSSLPSPVNSGGGFGFGQPATMGQPLQQLGGIRLPNLPTAPAPTPFGASLPGMMSSSPTMGSTNSPATRPFLPPLLGPVNSGGGLGSGQPAMMGQPLQQLGGIVLTASAPTPFGISQPVMMPSSLSMGSTNSAATRLFRPSLPSPVNSGGGFGFGQPAITSAPTPFGTSQPGHWAWFGQVAARAGPFNSAAQGLLQGPSDGTTSGPPKKRDKIETLKLLMTKDSNINCQDGNQRTPLHLVVNASTDSPDESKKLEHFMLKNGADPFIKDVRGRLPIHYLFVKIGRHTVKSATDPVESYSILSMAMKNQKLDEPDMFGQTPLHRAAYRGATVCAMLLLQRGCNINAKDNHGNTPMSFAVWNRHDSCALMMMQKGADINADVITDPFADIHPDILAKKREAEGKPNENGPVSNSLTNHASDSDAESDPDYEPVNDRISDVFGSSESDRNSSDSDSDESYVPKSRKIHQVIHKNISDIKRKPVWKHSQKHFPRPWMPGKKGYPVLQGLVMNNWTGLTFMAMDLLEPFGMKYAAAVEIAIDLGKFRFALNLMEKQLDNEKLREKNAKGENLLHILARKGSWGTLQRNIVDDLVTERGVDVNEQDNDKFTAIHHCILNKNWDHASYLVQTFGSINLDLKDKFGRNPVAALIWFGGPRDLLKKLLVLRGASADVRVDYPPMSVLEGGYLPHVHIEDYHKVYKNKTISPLINAIVQGWPYKFIQVLLKKASPNFADSEGMTPLMYAVQSGDILMVQLLFTPKMDVESYQRRDKDLKEKIRDGLTPHKVPTDDDLFAGVKPLTAPTSKLDVNQVDLQGRTALHHLLNTLPSGTYEDLHILKMLSDAKAALDVKDKEGKSPLDLALERKAVTMAKGIQSLLGVPKAEWRLPTFDPFVVDDNVKWDGTEYDFLEDAKNMLKEYEEEEAKLAALQPRAEVDNSVNDKSDWEVVLDEEIDVHYDILMTKVDVKLGEFGLYNFYKMQVVHDAKKDLYMMINRWGRIGDKGQFQRTPFRSAKEATDEFAKIFKAKSGNEWKSIKSFEAKPKRYRLIEADHRYTNKKVEVKYDLKTELPSKLPKYVQDLMADLSNVAMLRTMMRNTGIDIPFGRLKKETLIKAKDLLLEIKDHAEKIDELESRLTTENIDEYRTACEQVSELSSEYYYLIPASGYEYERLEPLKSTHVVQQRLETLSQLLELEFTGSMLLGAQYRIKEINPYDYLYRAMKSRIQQLPEKCAESQTILRYILASSPNQDIEAIYRLERAGEPERLQECKVDNHMLLWHGSRTSNLISILSRGLLIAPKDAPMTGMAFGQGIYTADTFCKSSGYCHNDGNSSGSRYMLLCEVALGKEYHVDDNCHLPGDLPPAGHNSLKADGTTVPDPRYTAILPTGTKIPLGANSENFTPYARSKDTYPYKYHRRTCNYNEYIAYSEDQVCLRYIVQFR